MIYLFPYIKYKLKFNSSEKVLNTRLYESVSFHSSLSFFSISNSFKALNGVKTENGFKIRRNIQVGYSTFLPTLFFKVHKEEGLVDVKIYFDIKVNIILTILFLFNLTLLLIDIGNLIWVFSLYVFTMTLFNLESMYLNKKLREIFIPEQKNSNK